MSETGILPGLPAYNPAPRLRKPPPSARGKIGAAAEFYGVGSKGDEDDVVEMAPRVEQLVDMPQTPHSDWTPDLVAAMIELCDRVIACGDVRSANLWRTNMAKRRGQYFDLEGLRRMTVTIERQAAGKAGVLVPVVPAVQYRDIADIDMITGTASYTIGNLPAELGDLVVGTINRLLREIAGAGFAHLSEVGYHRAPAHIADIAVRIRRITGSTVRVINQVAHLNSASRKGQTAHGPMRLPRRIMLVDSALAQLAEVLDVEAWTAVDLGLLTDQVRDLWTRRAATEPQAKAVARNLFDWAWPEPVNLSEEELLTLLQTHDDLAYVEQLRTERHRRGLLDL